MAPQEMTVDPAETERVIGAKLGADEIVRLLERMRHQARVDGGRVAVQVAAYRADVMHEYDLIEDAAIAHGYANIVPRLVPTMTVGRPQRIEELCESCRKVMTGLGFMETMTLLFTSPDESIKKLGLTDEGQGCRVENPASVEQTMMRQSLIPGLLATFRVNTTAEMPQHIFETGECFELDKNAETGARATRRLAAGLAGPKAGYADARQTQEALARELSATVRFAPLEGPQYIPGRAARVSLERGGTVVEWGVCGEIHPAVLERFGVTQPVSVFEVDLTLV
jgi:phenylalanyl-tRNA synthetase beta chain